MFISIQFHDRQADTYEVTSDKCEWGERDGGKCKTSHNLVRFVRNDIERIVDKVLSDMFKHLQTAVEFMSDVPSFLLGTYLVMINSACSCTSARYTLALWLKKPGC